MPIPTNFSPVEQFQDSIRRIFNPRIRRHFADIELDDDLDSDRGHLKRACLHQDKDSLLLTLGRFLLFLYFKLEQLFILLGVKEGLEQELIPQYYLRVINHPKILLFFAQDDGAVSVKKRQITAQISFRLIQYVNYKKPGEFGDVIDEAKLRAIAIRIRSEFRNYVWTKGDELYIYDVPFDGFFGSKCFTRDKPQAEEIFDKLCRVMQKSFNKKVLKLGLTPNKRSNNNPTETVIGYDNRSQKEPVYRPTAKVRFRHAVCFIGKNQPVVLVDDSGLLANPLVR
ncbi:hypothetical protein [Coleofasciculus sp. F4-SAH-05]|uniref:hypothetical protein n=1 Tax=Coleofasciculus sp. F4-SAH-05 TaxID=3069525 RepID=UPI0032F56DAE